MKRISVFFAMLLIGAFVLTIIPMAAEEPSLSSNSKAYIDFANGDNENNGTSASSAKKTLSSAISLLQSGGTIVASGKLYVGANYTVPAVNNTHLITSNDGSENYKNFEPKTNPACALKMASGVTLTFANDTIIDDIILFQETAYNNTIKITNNSTLVIGENVDCIGSFQAVKPCYMEIEVEAGSTAIIKSGTFQRITGEGTIINEGAKIIESEEYVLYTAAANALYAAGIIENCDNLDATLAADDAAHMIANLTGNSVFFANATVGEEEFLTAVLNALGHADVTDVFATANSLGIIDHTVAMEKFTRNDALNICTATFDVNVNTGETVADKLVNRGLVSERALGFAKRIAKGEKIIVACVGDSITEGVGASSVARYSYPAQLQKLLGNGFDVVNCGKSGSYVMNLESEYNVKAADRPDLWYPATAQYTKLMTSSPDVVIVMLGTNDARSMTAIPAEDVFVNDYKKLIADITALESEPDIYLSTMIPAVNSDITHQGTYYTIPILVRSIAKELDLPLIDTSKTLAAYYYAMLPYGDMVHPIDESYPALATNFYNEVFGYSKALPLLKSVKEDVVFLSSTGAYDNSGASPDEAVDTLGVAVAKLAKNGGTVVVCDGVDVSRTHLAACAGNITITSVYDGVDYRVSNNASLNIKGILTFLSDIMFENLTLNCVNKGLSINCGYNNFTVGENVECVGDYTIAINAGFRLASGAITAETVSCHDDCTISIASGKWSYICGGNQRTNSLTPFGTIDNDAKLSIYITGGEFTHVGTINVNSITGQNSVDGEVYMEISDGNFAGDVCAIYRTGSNDTGLTPTISGTVTLKVTGGEFGGRIALYHDETSTRVNGTSELIVARTLVDAVTTDDFTKVTVIDVATMLGDATGDNVVNLADVIRILKHIVDNNLEIFELNSDYDNSGTLDILDALSIFKLIINK